MPSGLHVIDVGVLVGFLLMTLIIGWWQSRSMKSESDFYLGGRHLGRVLQFFFNFGNMTDANSAATTASEVYRQGVGGVWLGLQTLFITPFFWFQPVWFRRIRLVTMADLFTDRFDSAALATSYAVFNIVMALLWLGLGNVVAYKVAAVMLQKPEAALTATEQKSVQDFETFSTLRHQADGGTLLPQQRDQLALLEGQNARGELHSSYSYLSSLTFYIGYTAVVCIYITMGGLKAAAITDAIQGTVLLLLTIVMVPLGLWKAGGFHGLHANVSATYFAVFGGATNSDYAWYTVLAITFTSLVQMWGLANNMAGSGSATDESAARFGMISGAFVKRVILIAWMLCGLVALAMFGGKLSDADNAWGTLSVALLPAGLLGLMTSSVLLGHMPAIGASAIAVAGLIVKTIYQPLLPGKTPRHYLRVGQAMTVGVLGLSILVSLFFGGVVTLITAAITFNAFFGVVVFLMFFWRGLTARAVGTSLAAWVILIGLVPWIVPQVPALRRSASLTATTTQHDELASTLAASPTGQAAHEIRDAHVQSVFFENLAPVTGSTAVEGVGRFNVEVYGLHLFGAPVGRWSKSQLVAARWALDGVLPFILLIGLSYLLRSPRVPLHEPPTEPERLSGDDSAGIAVATLPMRTARRTALVRADKTLADRFLVKLKTPVGVTPEAEAEQLALSLADPHRFDHLKLFPQSSWEFTRWSREDFVGFFGCWAVVGAILGLLWLVVRIGA